MTPIEPRSAGRRTLAAAVLVGMTFPAGAAVAHADEASSDDARAQDTVAVNEDQDPDRQHNPDDAEVSNDADQESDDSGQDQEQPGQQEETDNSEPAEPEVVEVAADPPYEAGQNLVSVPEVAGVSYTVAGAPVSGTIEVPEGGLSIIAVADEGHQITGQAEFYIDHTAPEPEPPAQPDQPEDDDTSPPDEDDPSDDATEDQEQQIEVVPEAPGHDHENNTVTIPEVEGVHYSEVGTVEVPEDGLTVTASAAEGYELAEGATASWTYDYTDEADEAAPSFEVVGTVLRGSGMDTEGSYTVTVTGEDGQIGTTTVSASADGTAATDLADIGTGAPDGEATVEVEGPDGFSWSGQVIFDSGDDQHRTPEVSVEGTTVSISNGQPDAEYTVAENGNSATVTTDASGNASLDAQTRLELEPGTYTLFVYGPGGDDEQWSESVSLTVDDDDEAQVEDLALSAETEQVDDGQAVTFTVESTDQHGDPVVIDPDDVEISGLNSDDEVDGLTVTFHGEGQRTITATHEDVESNPVTITVDEPIDYDPDFDAEDTVVTGTGMAPGATYEVEVTSVIGLPVGSAEIDSNADGDGSVDISDAGLLLPGATYNAVITGPDDFETTLEVTVPHEDEPGDPDPDLVTPETPSHTPDENTVVVDQQEGVVWSHGPGTVNVPEAGLTISASPAEGYEFDQEAQTEWEYAFVPEDDEPGDPDPSLVTPQQPGREANSVSVPNQDGVVFLANGQPVTGTVDISEAGLTITAVAAQGFQLEGQTTWSFEYSTDPEAPPGDPTDPDDPTDPEDPTDPGQPPEPPEDDPTEPAVPSEPPEDPVGPPSTEPEGPTDPEEPSDPEQPTEPPEADPTEPVEPTEPPRDPVEPVTPDESSESEQDGPAPVGSVPSAADESQQEDDDTDDDDDNDDDQGSDDPEQETDIAQASSLEASEEDSNDATSQWQADELPQAQGDDPSALEPEEPSGLTEQPESGLSAMEPNEALEPSQAPEVEDEGDDVALTEPEPLEPTESPQNQPDSSSTDDHATPSPSEQDSDRGEIEANEQSERTSTLTWASGALGGLFLLAAAGLIYYFGFRGRSGGTS